MKGKWILGVYIPVCKFCNDRGCLACDGERKKMEAEQKERKEKEDAAYAAAFPNGPQPIFVARFDNASELEQLKQIFGATAISERMNSVDGDMGKFSELTNRLASEAMLDREKQ